MDRPRSQALIALSRRCLRGACQRVGAGATWHCSVVPTGGIASIPRRWAVFARSTSINAQRSMIDGGIAHIRDTVMPVLSHLDGYLGLSFMVDRETGRGIVTSAWRSEEAMRQSADRVIAIRDAAVDVLGASEVAVDEWEVVV